MRDESDAEDVVRHRPNFGDIVPKIIERDFEWFGTNSTKCANTSCLRYRPGEIAAAHHGHRCRDQRILQTKQLSESCRNHWLNTHKRPEPTNRIISGGYHKLAESKPDRHDRQKGGLSQVPLCPALWSSAKLGLKVRSGSSAHIRGGSEPGRSGAIRPAFKIERLQCGGRHTLSQVEGFR